MTSLTIEKIAPHHAVENFDCGHEALNRYLARFVPANQRASTAQTYLGLADSLIAGYYTLVVGEVSYGEAPGRLAKGLAQPPIPIMLLARLAVSRDWQGRGLGAGLLKDAMRRTLQAAGIAGIRAFAVHAKDSDAAAFYRHFDFLPSPTDPLHLFLLIKDLKRSLSEP